MYKFRWAVAAVILTLLSIIWHYSDEASPTSSKHVCNPGANYCDSSISSLEQELRLSFDREFNCKSQLGQDVASLIRKIDEVKAAEKLWKKRAEQIRMTYSQCLDDVRLCAISFDACANQ